MSRNAKIILGVLGGLFLLCVCTSIAGWFALRRAGEALESSVTEEPAEVAALAEQIVEYELPPGYQEAFGMSLFSFDMVAFAPIGGDNGPSIMLMQLPPSVQMDQEEMERQLEQAMQNPNQQNAQNMQIVEERTITIRGQDVPLVTREGSTDDGGSLRQSTALFMGKKGTTMLMIAGSPEVWDQELLDTFIASLE